MASVDMCEHGWPGSGCRECFPKPVAVPLVERLRSIPRDAVLRIDTPNVLGCMDTRSIPVGRLCHEAADALGVNACRAEQRGPGEWVCDCEYVRPGCKPDKGVLRHTAPPGVKVTPKENDRG